jgi:branched-chain amino acid transport system substrate-binding protein
MPSRLAASACALALWACPGAQPREPEAGPDARVEPVLATRPQPSLPGAIRVATVFPTIGRYALSGRQSLNGVRLAVEDVNRAGGVHGRPVELLEYQTGSYFLDAARAAGLAVAEGRAVAIVGSNSSSLSIAVAEVAEAHGIVQVSNVSTARDLTWNPETGRERRFVFRVCVSDGAMGQLLARFARERLGARRVAVLYEVGRVYSAQLASSFIESFRDTSGERVAEEFFYLSLETDFRSQLQDVAAFGADALFVPGSFTDATLVGAQAAQLGIQGTLLGADGWSNRHLFSRGAPDRPSYYGDHCAPPEEFSVRYRREFGDEAEGCRAILAYDALRAVVAGLEGLGPLEDAALEDGLPETRRRLRDAVADVEVEGAAGTIRFDSHGDSRRSIAVMRVPPGGGPPSLEVMLGG